MWEFSLQCSNEMNIVIVSSKFTCTCGAGKWDHMVTFDFMFVCWGYVDNKVDSLLELSLSDLMAIVLKK